MTPKEALDWIENVFEEHHVQLPDVELTLLREALTELEELKQEVIDRQETEDSLTKWVSELTDEIDELKRYPTADEVCVALNMDNHLFPKVFFYDEISRTFKEIHLSRNEEIVSYYADGTVTINPNYGIPPHLITLIGRFYEGLEKVGK